MSTENPESQVSDQEDMIGKPHPDYNPLVRRRTPCHSRRPYWNILHWRSVQASHLRIALLRTPVILMLAVCLSVVASLLLVNRTYQNRILPNVTIRGMHVGQLSPTRARSTLAQHHVDFLAQPVTFVLGEHTWTPTPEQLGIMLDLDDAISRAAVTGHGLDPLTGIRIGWAIWRGGFEVPLHLRVDQRQLQEYLLDVAHTVDTPPHDAALMVSEGQIYSAAAQTGRQLLIDETIQDVMAALQTLQPQTVPLRTRLLHPVVNDMHAAAAEQQLQQLLQSPVTLTAGERTWIWTPEKIGSLVRLSLVPDPDGPGEQVVASLDQRRLRRWLEQLGEEVYVAPVEPRLRFATSGLQIIREGSDGVRLDVDQAVEQLMTGLWHDERTLALPVQVIQPQVRPETLASLGIVELVAQGKSSFLNSEPYRITNIVAGARRMDGVLIAPGSEFSFNRTIGAINTANGFTRGYAIVNGRTQLEWGGGVCQVSTTVFRAAFWAGVPITERNQHTFRITWYEKFEPIGMDAAIFTGPGGYDVRFVNDTGHWLLMEAYADTTNEVLTINLYGTRPDREVIQSPPQVTYPGGGYTNVNIGRTVRRSDGTVISQDNFFSRFRPW